MRRIRHPIKHFSPRHLYLRSFILSFCFSLLAMLSVLAASLASGGFLELSRSLASSGSDSGEAAQVLGTAENIPVVQEGLSGARVEDSLTVLIMGVKDKESVSNTYLLVRFDPEKGRIPVAGLPPQTMVVKPQGDKTPIPLSEAYRFGGHALTVQALENTLNIPIDRYVVVDTRSFLKIAGIIGPVQYQLGQTLSYQDTERSIQLSKGMQLVDGQKAIDIATYPNYPGGDAARADITASLAVQIINSRISLAASATAEELFKAVVNRIKTNITYLDFEQRRSLAAGMESLSPAIQVFPDGGFSADGSAYTLSDSAIKTLKAYFGR